MSTPTTILLVELPQDVLLHILFLSDVSTVLRVSQVNRYLCSIAGVKQLWVSLITDIRQRSLMEVPPSYNPSQYSVPELIEHVKTVVLGPGTWEEDDSPQLACQIEVPLGVQGAHFEGGGAKLLNGGRHVAIVRHSAMGIWDVGTKRRIWRPTTTSMEFSAVSVTDAGKLTLATLSEDRMALEILQIDLQDGKPTSLAIISLPLPGTLLDEGLVGRLVVLHLLPTCDVLLVDWRVGMYVLLTGFTPIQPSIGLIPGYLIINPWSETQPQFFIYAIAAFDFGGDWHPVSDLASCPVRLPLEHLMPMSVETLTIDGRRTMNDVILGMSIHESALQPGVYKITAYRSGPRVCQRHGPPRKGGVLSWKFRIFPEFQTIRTTSRYALPHRRLRQFSSSGYFMELGATNKIYRFSEDHEGRIRRGPLLDTPHPCISQTLSSYNCVVVSLMPSSLVFSYYL
ncbi:hypothetical protein C8R43DRAFT_1035338 [Mycena crocata]|nr:hypothetical protein C8R43DRAFT_1035338 [Mycena crocata]